MARRFFTLSGLILFAALSSAAAAPAEEKGYALMDQYILAFKSMAERGAGGPDEVNKTLDSIMAETAKAKEQGSIDPLFYHRFRRLLQVTKLAIIHDPAGILIPLIEREIGVFVEDVKGETSRIDGSKGGIGVGAVADALAEELINLHLLLDGKKHRERLKQEFMNKFQAPQKKKDPQEQPGF